MDHHQPRIQLPIGSGRIVAVGGGGRVESPRCQPPVAEDGNVAGFILERWLAAFRSGTSDAMECLYHNKLTASADGPGADTCLAAPCPQMLQFSREVDGIIKANKRVKDLEAQLVNVRAQVINGFDAAQSSYIQLQESKRNSETSTASLKHAYSRIEQLTALYEHEASHSQHLESQIATLSSTNSQLLQSACQASQTLIDTISAHNEAVDRLNRKVQEREERNQFFGLGFSPLGNEVDGKTISLERALDAARSSVQRLEFERDLETKARMALLERYDGVAAKMKELQDEKTLTAKKFEGVLVVLQRILAVSTPGAQAEFASAALVRSASPLSYPVTPTSAMTNFSSSPPSSLDTPPRTPRDSLNTFPCTPTVINSPKHDFFLSLAHLSPSDRKVKLPRSCLIDSTLSFEAAKHGSEDYMCLDSPGLPLPSLPLMHDFDEDASLAALFDEDVKRLSPVVETLDSSLSFATMEGVLETDFIPETRVSSESAPFPEQAPSRARTNDGTATKRAVLVTRQPLGPLCMNSLPPMRGTRHIEGTWRQGPPPTLNNATKENSSLPLPPRSTTKLTPSLPPILTPSISANGLRTPSTPTTPSPRTPSTPTSQGGQAGHHPYSLAEWFDPEWTEAFLTEELVKRNKFRSRRQRKQFRDVQELKVHMAKERRERARLEGKRVVADGGSGAAIMAPSGVGLGLHWQVSMA